MITWKWVAKSYLVRMLLLAVMVQASYVECCIEEERQALLEIKAYLKPYTDTNGMFDSERNREDCCAWSLVRCNPHSGRVIQLDLRDMDFGQDDGNKTWLFNVTLFRPFQQLIRLDLSGNNINDLVEKDGSTRISSLKNLRKLNLNNNNFGTGNISLGALVSLQELSISACGVDESILPGREFANMTELVLLDAQSNLYKHSLKEFWACTLRKMERLTLLDNGFTGRLPSCLLNLTSLQVLDLSQNNLSGKVLPNMLQNLSMLTYLDLSDDI